MASNKKGKKLKLDYPDEKMQDALKDVAAGMSIRAAAKLHQVPRITLLNKYKGKYPSIRKMGPASVLSNEEESIVVTWIQSVSRAGFPVTKRQLLDSVQELIKTLGRSNNFTNGRPGRSWYASFIQRNPTITSRLSENLTLSRANVTSTSLEKWYSVIYNFLKDSQLDHILETPGRVFNCDESAFFLNPKGNRVLAIKGDKNVYQVVNSDEKECITVLVTGSAAGQLPPPLIVFKYKRIPDDVGRSIPVDWGLGKSESGWMTGQVFYDYLVNIFHPWLLREKIPLPVIMFVDGHTSHLTMKTSQFCEENQIVLIALHPNATHILQPLDVSVFRSLKSKWKQIVHQWRLDHCEHPVLRKKDFAPLLQQALQMITADTISSGFRKCGLCPWNPQEVLNPVKSQAQKDIHQRKESVYGECQIVLRVMNELLSAQQLELFKQQGETYSGDLEHKSLFSFWKSVKSIASQSSDSSSDLPVDEALSPHDIENIDNPDLAINWNVEKRVGNPPIVTNDQNNSTESQTSIADISSTSTSPKLPAVPSPFKKALNWKPLNYVQNQTNASRGIGPGAVTSKQWQEEYRKKMEKKQEAEESRKRRAEERLQKKEEREELKRRKKEEKEKKKQSKLQSNTKKKRRRTIPTESSSEEEWHSSQETQEAQDIAIEDMHIVIIPDETINMEDDEEQPVPSVMILNETTNINNYEDLPVPAPSISNVSASDGTNFFPDLESIDPDEMLHEEELPVPLVSPSPLNEAQSLTKHDESSKGPALNEEKTERATPQFVVAYSSKKKNVKVLYKIVDELAEGEYITHLMKPCNRFRTVFAEDICDVRIITDTDIAEEVLQPLVFGNNERRRYQFPQPIDVQW